MTDDKRKNQHEEEYQFPDDDYMFDDEPAVEQGEQTVEADMSAEQPNVADDEHGHDDMHDDYVEQANAHKPSLTERFPFLRNKRVLVVTGIAVVALIGFKIMSPSHETKVVQSKPVQTQPAVSAVVKSDIESLKQQVSQNSSTISDLHSQVSAVNSSVNQANATQAQMNTQIQALTDQVKELTATIKNMTAKKTAKKKHVKPIVYNTKAVVTGRAWIIDNHGQTTSVRIGDHVPQYGTVTAINPNTGMILTSSGKTIDYGSNDS